MPWNEVSRRYVDDEPEFYIPEQWRAKADNVKQGSSSLLIDKMFLMDSVTGDKWENDISNVVYLLFEQCCNIYELMLEAGICAEQARIVLPQGMQSEWIWSGTLGAFADMLVLRLDEHTQYESRIVAEMIKTEVEKLFPVSLSALLEYN